MKALRRHFIKNGSAYARNVSGERKPQGRCFTRLPNFQTTPPSRTSDFAVRIRNALNTAGVKTIRAVREISDAALLNLPDFGSSSLSYLREKFCLPSIDGLGPHN
jgi:DNA-directed RNA polymerase alpha subunit